MHTAIACLPRCCTERSYASVAVMNASKAMRPTHTGKLGEAVGEIAKCGASRDSDHPKGGNGNTRACIEAVQQDHETGDRRGRDCE